jgi:hypothetical protein
MVWTLLTMSGCTIGPTVETRYVVVHPGQPIRILSTVTANGERLDGAGVAEFDISGWVVMPPDHWATIKALLESKSVAPDAKKVSP